MANTAISILADYLGEPEDNTQKLLESLEKAPALSDDARAELLEKLIAAERFNAVRHGYPARVATPRLSDARRLERPSSTSSAPTIHTDPPESPPSVVYLRKRSFFHNVVSVLKLARLALSSGHGTLLYIRSEVHQIQDVSAKLGTVSDVGNRNQPTRLDS